jgi:basic membrane protein A
MRNVRIASYCLAIVATITLSLAPSLVSASSVVHNATPAVKTKVGIGVLFEENDRGFNSLANGGLKMAKSKLHVTGNLVVAATVNDCVPTLQSFVKQHDNLIIAVGDFWGNAVYKVAKANPKMHFAIVDGVPVDAKGNPIALPNVSSLFFKTEQSGYLVGVIAGLMEKDKVGIATHNTIGVLGAFPIDFVNGQMCGYVEGARSVDPGIKIVDDYAYQFTDPPTGQALGNKQVGEGADILFGVADATGLGYYRAADAAHKWAIGFAADQDYLGSYMLTSAEVKVQTAVLRTIQSQVKGKFKAGSHYYTLSNGGVSYATNMHHVPSKIKAYVAAVEKKVASGKIAVSADCKLPQ